MSISKFKEIIDHAPRKTFLVKSLGCRTNQAEVLAIAGWLEKQGWKSDSVSPYLIIINTCAVTQKGFAESKRTAKLLKKRYPQAKIIPIGCGVSFSPQAFSFASFTFDNPEKEKILQKINCPFSFQINHPFPRSHRFLLRIQSGCRQFCTYCIVPFLRSSLISLPPAKAIHLIKQAEKKGFQEVVLTGTNLSFYRGKSFSLLTLLRKIEKETSLPRISFGSLNPEGISPSLINFLKKRWQTNSPRFSRYLHLPLQSGSEKILKKMNRPYHLSQYLKVVDKLTQDNPFLGLGTDIIVGFPGETEKEFKETVKIIQQLPFSRLHVFRYNPRPGTAAAKMEKEWGRVSKEEKIRRAALIRKIGKEKEKAFKEKLIGKTLPVLFLEQVAPQKWYGLTDNYIGITYPSSQNLQGKIVSVKITSRLLNL